MVIMIIFSDKYFLSVPCLDILFDQQVANTAHYQKWTKLDDFLNLILFITLAFHLWPLNIVKDYKMSQNSAKYYLNLLKCLQSFIKYFVSLDGRWVREHSWQ